MAKDSEAKNQITNFHKDNTVEIMFKGKKRRVNKFEADALKSKLAKNKAKETKGDK